MGSDSSWSDEEVRKASVKRLKRPRVVESRYFSTAAAPETKPAVKDERRTKPTTKDERRAEKKPAVKDEKRGTAGAEGTHVDEARRPDAAAGLRAAAAGSLPPEEGARLLAAAGLLPPEEGARLLEQLQTYVCACGGAWETGGEWHVVVETRKTGKTAGSAAATRDAYYIAANGKRYRSRLQVAREHFGIGTAGPRRTFAPLRTAATQRATQRATQSDAAPCDDASDASPDAIAHDDALSLALGAFVLAAELKGNAAFEEQRSAADFVLSAVEADASAAPQRLGAVLRVVLEELRRLHINFSCRVRQRSREVADCRSALTAMIRHAKRVHARVDPAGAAAAKLAASERKARRARHERRELKRGVPCGDRDDASSGGASSSASSTASAPPASLRELRERCSVFVETSSCDHLCAHLCYYREHEPARELFELRRRVAEAAGDARALDGWVAELRLAAPAAGAAAPDVPLRWRRRPPAARGGGPRDARAKHRPWRVVYVDRGGHEHTSAADALTSVGLDGPALAPRWPIASHGGSGVRLTKTQMDRLDLVAESEALRRALWDEADEARIFEALWRHREPCARSRYFGPAARARAERAA
ncbi:hypothetical protein M885DRAFT_568303, partial [Pelagophyceae sp. CCMP2097]